MVRGGEIHRLTRDQTYTELLVEAGLLAPCEVDLSPFPNTVLQAIGQSQDIQVALSTLRLRDRDCLLLCSDGLTTAMDDAEIAAAVVGAGSLDVACRKLVDLANLRGGADNVSVVVAGVFGGDPASSHHEPVADTHRVITSYAYPCDVARVRA